MIKDKQYYTKMINDLKKNLFAKDEALDSATSTINLLENNKIKIEVKLNSYRGTVRNLIREKEDKELKDKR